jgi:hypothetical protein
VTLEKAKTVLASFHRDMFPDEGLPTTIDTLLGTYLGTTALADFSREQTTSGAETALTLAMASGIAGDYVKAFSGHPKDSRGKEVDLTPFAQ